MHIYVVWLLFLFSDLPRNMVLQLPRNILFSFGRNIFRNSSHRGRSGKSLSFKVILILNIWPVAIFCTILNKNPERIFMIDISLTRKSETNFLSQLWFCDVYSWNPLVPIKAGRQLTEEEEGAIILTSKHVKSYSLSCFLCPSRFGWTFNGK